MSCLCTLGLRCLLPIALFFHFSVALAATAYDIGSPVVTDIWVDPVSGADANSGLTQTAPLKTLTAAWAKTPESNTFTGAGYRINLLPGAYPCEPGPEQDNCQNYFGSRHGTHDYPLIIRSVDGPGTVTLRGGLNLNDLSYFYLLDVTLTGGGASLPTNSSGNNLLHFEGSNHILLRGVTLSGPDCANDQCNNLQEVLKVNQTQYMYVEDSTIGGAWHSAVDYFVVQFGHFVNNNIHTAGQWGMYVKGGSAYLLVEGNEFHDTQLGFQAGQAANLAMMLSPWLHYEAYDIKFVNNLLHDIPGVGISVAGGYNILIAHNTLYNVGTSTDPGYPMMTFVHGERNCTATDELPLPAPACQALAVAGGWGPVAENSGEAVIPNRNVRVYNNILYNPTGQQTLYSHFGFEGEASPGAGIRNISSGARADDSLSIRGNVIWNGGTSMPTGAGDTGCLDGNAFCNNAQLLADNAINTIEPQLANTSQNNFHPTAGGNIAHRASLAIPDFDWSDAPTSPEVPQGNLSNQVATDLEGNARSATQTPPGAYASSGGATGSEDSAWEFYKADINHYFMTAYFDEAASLDSNTGWNWMRTGETYNIWLAQASAPSNALPVCRFYGVFANGTVGSHFYTIDTDECEYVKSRNDWGWGYEGFAFYAVKPSGGSCQGGTSPIYRAYNNGMGGAPNHRYMTSQTEMDTMVAQGWVSEGTAFCGAQ